MLTLPTGVILLLYTIYLIRLEPRRFANAISLMTALVFLCHGVGVWYSHFYPPLVEEGNGTYIMTSSGTLNFYLFILLLLFVLLVGIALIINGCKLIGKESLSLAHALPILFGTLCITLVVVDIVYIFYIRNNDNMHFLSVFVANVIAYLEGAVVYVPFTLLAYLLYSLVYQCVAKTKQPDYLIVLGASLTGEKVSPLLAKRLDKAITIYHTNKNRPFIVVSGGQGKNEVVSEALAMKNYLLQQGIPEEHIRMEDRSVNTYENMKFSKEIIDPEFDSEKTQGIFTTNNFHVLRSAIIARSVGLKVHGIGCKTAGYYYPAASIREAIAFIFGYKKIAAAYLMLLLAYRCIRIFLPTFSWLFW